MGNGNGALTGGGGNFTIVFTGEGAGLTGIFQEGMLLRHVLDGKITGRDRGPEFLGRGG